MSAPIETERKFIILRPDENILKSQTGYTESKIEQIYLKGDKGITNRVRKREYGDVIVFTKTKKTRLSKMSVIEEECEITEAEYESKRALIDEGLHPVRKTRRTFVFGGYTIEIDTYDEWKRCAILEVELKSESERPHLPDFIRVIAEVTGEKSYSNHSMAKCFPKEPI